MTRHIEGHTITVYQDALWIDGHLYRSIHPDNDHQTALAETCRAFAAGDINWETHGGCRVFETRGEE